LRRQSRTTPHSCALRRTWRRALRTAAELLTDPGRRCIFMGHPIVACRPHRESDLRPTKPHEPGPSPSGLDAMRILQPVAECGGPGWKRRDAARVVQTIATGGGSIRIRLAIRLGSGSHGDDRRSLGQALAHFPDTPREAPVQQAPEPRSVLEPREKSKRFS